MKLYRRFCLLLSRLANLGSRIDANCSPLLFFVCKLVKEYFLCSSILNEIENSSSY